VGDCGIEGLLEGHRLHGGILAQKIGNNILDALPLNG
jgi:hypothetical protein